MQSDGASAGRIRPGAPERARPALAVYVTRVSPNARGESTEQRERDAAGVTRGEWSVMIDRIAEPWGPRTPYAPGGSNGNWPARVDQFLEGGVDRGDVERWVQSAAILHSNGDAMDIAVRDGRIVGVRGRAGDRVNHGRLGPKDLFGWQANDSPDRLHAAAGPRGRTAGRDRLGRRRWAASSSARGSCSPSPAAGGGSASTPAASSSSRSTTRSAVIGKAGHRHAAHGRQHAAVHGDRRGGAEGELRHRRPARLVRGRRPLRRDRAVGPQRRRDADRAVDADARSPARPRSARGCWPSIPAPTPVAREADIHLAPRPAPTWRS